MADVRISQLQRRILTALNGVYEAAQTAPERLPRGMHKDGLTADRLAMVLHGADPDGEDVPTDYDNRIRRSCQALVKNGMLTRTEGSEYHGFQHVRGRRVVYYSLPDWDTEWLSGVLEAQESKRMDAALDKMFGKVEPDRPSKPGRLRRMAEAQARKRRV